MNIPLSFEELGFRILPMLFMLSEKNNVVVMDLLCYFSWIESNDSQLKRLSELKCKCGVSVAVCIYLISPLGEKVGAQPILEWWSSRVSELTSK